jgi:hypothetical protein
MAVSPHAPKFDIPTLNDSGDTTKSLRPQIVIRYDVWE